MSSQGEPASTNPDDLTYYAPRELRERAKSPPLTQQVRSETARSQFSYRASSDVQPVFLRPPSAPEAILQSGVLERDDKRATLFSVASRFAAVAACVVVVALLFIVMSPTLRQFDASSTSAETAGSIRSEVTGSRETALAQSSKGQNGAKPALAEFQGVLASIPASKPATPEQSPQLQQFLQWRQKSNPTEISQSRDRLN